MTDDPGCLGSTTVNVQAHRGYVVAGPRLDRGGNSDENRGETRVNAQTNQPATKSTRSSSLRRAAAIRLL